MSSTSGEPPEEPVFCVDEALGSRTVPEALRTAGLRVVLLSDRFGKGSLDLDWLPEVGRLGWVVLTKDKRLRRRPSELVAIVRHGVRAFILTGGNMKGSDMADAFRIAAPRMKRLLRSQTGPFVAAVSRSGGVSLVYPPR